MITKSDRIWLAVLILSFSLQYPAKTAAYEATDDWCLKRVETSLATLSSNIGEFDGAQEASLLEELSSLCQEARAKGSAVVAGQAGSKAPSVSNEASSTILGVEFRRAPSGADGYERVKK
jgi:hypothetical protein